MLKFLTKEFVWGRMDEGLHRELGWNKPQIHLKTWQDLAVYHYLRGKSGLKIAEIGGGTSRILKKLSEKNECYNVDKFAGDDGGPNGEYHIKGVKNVISFLGEFNPELKDNFFDVVASVSVIEHVPNEATTDFVNDMVRILKPGGLAIHAIDMYVGDNPKPHTQARLDIYRAWLDHPDVVPIEAATAERAMFRSNMVSNPDLTMWNWCKSAPALTAMRTKNQSTSLLFGFTKKPAK